MLPFFLGAVISAGIGFYFYKTKACEQEFVFMRLYGHLREDAWEILEDYPPDIEDTDAFRVLIRRGKYYEVVVPIALPVIWNGETFVYKGIWPVKNR